MKRFDEFLADITAEMGSEIDDALQEGRHCVEREYYFGSSERAITVEVSTWHGVDVRVWDVRGNERPMPNVEDAITKAVPNFYDIQVAMEDEPTLDELCPKYATVTELNWF